MPSVAIHTSPLEAFARCSGSVTRCKYHDSLNPTASSKPNLITWLWLVHFGSHFVRLESGQSGRRVGMSNKPDTPGILFVPSRIILKYCADAIRALFGFGLGSGNARSGLRHARFRCCRP